MVSMSLEQETKDKALELGFDAAGITDASPIGPEHVEHFEAWLRSGYAGRMHDMHRNLDRALLASLRTHCVVEVTCRAPIDRDRRLSSQILPAAACG